MNNPTFREYLKSKKSCSGFIVIISLYLAFLTFSAIYWIINFHLRNLCMSIGYMLFVPAIFILEYFLKLRVGAIFTGLLLFIATTSILGSCFNFYTTIPFLDLIQHCVAGVAFAALGFALANLFFGVSDQKKSFFGCLLFGVFFSLAIATLWEIFEYSLSFLGFDMMEDTYVNQINSYLLSGSHNQAVNLENITQTQIIYDNGKSYVVNGYVDIGLIDTLGDMIICSIGAVVFALVSIISYYKAPCINRALIPQLLKNLDK